MCLLNNCREVRRRFPLRIAHNGTDVLEYVDIPLVPSLAVRVSRLLRLVGVEMLDQPVKKIEPWGLVRHDEKIDTEKRQDWPAGYKLRLRLIKSSDSPGCTGAKRGLVLAAAECDPGRDLSPIHLDEGDFSRSSAGKRSGAHSARPSQQRRSLREDEQVVEGKNAQRRSRTQ